VNVVFRWGPPGPDQKVRRVPGRIDSILRHGAVVTCDGDRNPQTKRFADLELIPEEVERVQAERAARRRIVSMPKHRLPEPPATVEVARPIAVEPLGPLANEVDALIDARPEPTRPVMVGLPPDTSTIVHAVVQQARQMPATILVSEKPAPAPAVPPVQVVEIDPLKRLISDSASAAESLLGRAGAIETSIGAMAGEAGELSNQIAALEQRRAEIHAQMDAKKAELAKVLKAIDAIAAIEALGDS